MFARTARYGDYTILYYDTGDVALLIAATTHGRFADPTEDPHFDMAVEDLHNESYMPTLEQSQLQGSGEFFTTQVWEKVVSVPAEVALPKRELSAAVAKRAKLYLVPQPCLVAA